MVGKQEIKEQGGKWLVLEEDDDGQTGRDGAASRERGAGSA